MQSYRLNTERPVAIGDKHLAPSMAEPGSETASKPTSSAKDYASHTQSNDSGSSGLGKATLPNPNKEEKDKEKQSAGLAHTEETQEVEIIALKDLWRKIARGNRLAASMTSDTYEGEVDRGIATSRALECCNSVTATLAAMAPRETQNDKEENTSDSE